MLKPGNIRAWFDQFKAKSFKEIAQKLINLATGPDRLKPSNENMRIGERPFREAVRSAVKGLIVVGALVVLCGICSLAKMDSNFFGLTINEWLEVLVTMAITGVAIKFYQPVKTIITFYLIALPGLDATTNRNRYLGTLVSIAGKLTLLVYVISISACLSPPILQCNDGFMHFSALPTLLDACIWLAAIGITGLLLKDALPLLVLLRPKELFNALIGPGRLKASNSSMLIEEKVFREALRKALQGLAAIVALVVLNSITSFFKFSAHFFDLTLNQWIETLITLAIVGLAIKFYRPVNTVLTYYLILLLKVGKLPGRDQYLGNIVAAAFKLTLLIYIMSVFKCLLPLFAQFRSMRYSSTPMLLNMSIGTAALGIGFALWKDAQPLIDLLTGNITNKVSAAPPRTASVECPACKTANDQHAAFCISCGGPIRQTVVAASTTAVAAPLSTAPMSPKHAFISHSSQDHALAERVCAVLEGSGLNCWIAPRDIEPGASYDEEILCGIERSRTFVLLLSGASNASPHVKRELMVALRANHAVYPIRIQEVQPGPKLEYLLEGIHWIDAWTPPIETHLNRLAQLISKQSQKTDVIPKSIGEVSHNPAADPTPLTSPPASSVVIAQPPPATGDAGA